MGIEVTLLTALVTLAVLAGASIYLVAKYRRTHASQIRESLMRQARKYAVAAPDELTNHDLAVAIHDAKRESKQRQMKTA